MKERIKDEVLSKIIEEAIEDDVETSLDSGQNPTCWSKLDEDKYCPSYPIISSVPAGLYEIHWDSKLQSNLLKKLSLITDELYELPSAEITTILDDIELFWSRRDVYKSYNFIHKRGILLYGDPGCGKSGIVQLCVKRIIDIGGIVINIKEEEDITRFSEFIPTFKKIEPDRQLIVILEDIDSLVDDDYSISNLLNILDGIKQIENIVYIATTNYPEVLQERITNRPSRFDRRYEIKMPNAEIRKAYIEKKLTITDLERIDLDEWVKLTDGMSLAHLKELIISVIVMGRSFADAIDHLSNLKKKPKISRAANVGFR